MLKIKLDNDFEITSDRYNIILSQTKKTGAGKPYKINLYFYDLADAVLDYISLKGKLSNATHLKQYAEELKKAKQTAFKALKKYNISIENLKK